MASKHFDTLFEPDPVEMSCLPRDIALSRLAARNNRACWLVKSTMYTVLQQCWVGNTAATTCTHPYAKTRHRRFVVGPGKTQQEEERRAASGKRTSQQEGGTVGTKLSPETGEEVDELEGGQALLAGEGGVGSRSDVEEDSVSSKTKKLQPEAAYLWVVDHSSSQPVPDQGHSTVQQCPQQGFLQIWTADTSTFEQILDSDGTQAWHVHVQSQTEALDSNMHASTCLHVYQA